MLDSPLLRGHVARRLVPERRSVACASAPIAGAVVQAGVTARRPDSGDRGSGGRPIGLPPVSFTCELAPLCTTRYQTDPSPTRFDRRKPDRWEAALKFRLPLTLARTSHPRLSHRDR